MSEAGQGSPNHQPSRRGDMLFLASMCIVAALTGGTLHFWEQSFAARDPRYQWTFLDWWVRGLVIPMGVWAVLNAGLITGFPPLLGHRQLGIPGTAAWWRTVPDLVGPSLIVLACWWSVVTLAWLLAGLVPLVEARGDLVKLVLVWTVLTLPFTAAFLWKGRLLGVGFALLLWLLPVIHTTLQMANPHRNIPLYARAIARIKFGKYREAEAAVIQELEKSGEDFQGWLMLAELYAHHFHDLAQADQTVRDLCTQPNVGPSQASLALHRLADWHLKLADDPVAARSALELICLRWPGTHAAHMAEQRLLQLPGSTEELREQRVVRPLRLPALADPLDNAPAASEPATDPQAARERAERCVEKLRKNPNGVEAREELARLLMRELHQPERGIEQLDLLLSMPDQPEPRRAEWLSLIAACHLQQRRDLGAARNALERIVREFPQSRQAFTARRHLDVLEQSRTGSDRVPKP